MTKLNKKEIKMLVHFLDQYDDVMSNAGCNDVPSSLWKAGLKKKSNSS